MNNKKIISYKNIFNISGLEIFVIGGSGLIGLEIVSTLLNLDAKVTVFDTKIIDKTILKKKI